MLSGVLVSVFCWSLTNWKILVSVWGEKILRIVYVYKKSSSKKYPVF